MALHDLTPSVRAFLEERRYAVIATINETGMPQLTAIWYALQGETVLMNTVAGRLKHRNLQRDPRMSICVVDDERYVTLYGQAVLIDDQAQAHEDDRRLAVRYEGPEKAEERARMIAGQQRVTIQMTLTHVHARGFEP